MFRVGRHTGGGNIGHTFGLDGTYIARYDNNTNPADPDGVVTHVAGTYNKTYGLYSRVRGRLFVNWQKGDLGASWRIRYVGPFDVGSADWRWHQLRPDESAFDSPQHHWIADARILLTRRVGNAQRSEFG